MKYSMRGVARRGPSVLAFLLMGALWGCQSRNLSPPPLDPVPMERSGYVVGVQDVLQISVWKNEELSVVVPVRSDGKISVPLVDDVQALCPSSRRADHSSTRLPHPPEDS